MYLKEVSKCFQVFSMVEDFGIDVVVDNNAFVKWKKRRRCQAISLTFGECSLNIFTSLGEQHSKRYRQVLDFTSGLAT